MSLFSKLSNINQPKAPSKPGAVDPVMAQVVINTISDGIAIIDPNGIIQLFNPAAEQLTGWKAADAVSLDYRSIFNLCNSAGHDIDASENPITKAMSTGQLFTADNTYIQTQSGKKIQIAITVSPIAASGGNSRTNGIVIAFRDITRERAEQNQQTDFISTAAHEMRTPVATIEGYLGMILNPKICNIDDSAREYATKAHTSVQHLGQLFRDLLDITKADDGRLETHPSLLDAIIATRQLVETFRPKADAKGLLLNFKNDASKNDEAAHGIRVLSPPAIIYADLDYFNEAVGNLIENAIKYTQEGSVTVSVDVNGDRARISVTDTGIGIPPEDIPHLFQKFYRVDNSETREISGTGLGLYLIKKLVTAMGGTVGVSSEYGKGSVFWAEFDNLTHEQAIQKAREIKLAQRKQELAKEEIVGPGPDLVI